MKTSYQDIIKGKNVLIIGSGRTIRDYYKKICSFVNDNNPIIFGVNYMTDFFTPDFHFWTNKQRYRDLGNCIKKASIMMFGCNIPVKLIKMHHSGYYHCVYYKDEPKYKGKLIITEGMVKGFFRNAGSLAVVITKIMGANSISMVGIDGYTLHAKSDLKKKNKSHHCYGSGFTDDATYDECILKDKYIYNSYNTIYKSGIQFKILTPTKYDKFYDPLALEI